MIGMKDQDEGSGSFHIFDLDDCNSFPYLLLMSQIFSTISMNLNLVFFFAERGQHKRNIDNPKPFCCPL